MHTSTLTPASFVLAEYKVTVNFGPFIMPTSCHELSLRLVKSGAGLVEDGDWDTPVLGVVVPPPIFVKIWGIERMHFDPSDIVSDDERLSVSTNAKRCI